MYDHPEFIALELAERYDAMRQLAASEHIGGGTPFLSRLSALAHRLQPAAARAAATRQAQPSPLRS